MGAAKTFSEWWRSMGPIDYKMDRRSAEIAWNAAQKTMEIAPSASANSAMDTICPACKDTGVVNHGVDGLSFCGCAAGERAKQHQ